MRQGLDARLIAAHAAADVTTLVALYRQAADQAGSEAERGFFLTQGYVFALEAGLPEAETLRAALVRLGRETD